MTAVHNNKDEITWIHIARVVACLMVVGLHSLPPLQEYVVSGSNLSFWKLVVVITKPCVPLFFMITGYLILPYTNGDDIASFYRKRIPRVLYPLLIWGVVYAILPWLLGLYDAHAMIHALILSPVQAPGKIGGILWYLFILIGIYLIIPFLSSRIYSNEKVLKVYLLLFVVSTFVVVASEHFHELLGQNNLHTFNLTLYFSGYLGYCLLGYYFKRNGGPRVGVGGVFVCLLILVVFSYYVPVSTVRFLSVGTLLMTLCCFLLLSRVRISASGILYHIIKDISASSFGIYLCQMVVFRSLTIRIYEEYGTFWYVQIMVMLLTFIGAYIITKIISNLPIKKYIIG